jgi:chromatin structure-remodeling complex subunit RSC1/2
MCDSRYNDRERMFVRIKNWNSCVPEEVRKSDEFMPIYLFERTVFPRKGPSPFFGKGAVKGPGGIDENVGKDDGDKDKEKDLGAAGGAAGSRKRSSRRTTAMEATIKQTTTGNVSSAMTPPQYPYQSYPLPQQSYTLQNKPQTDSVDRTVITAAGGLAALGNNAFVEKLSPEISQLCFYSASFFEFIID